MNTGGSRLHSSRRSDAQAMAQGSLTVRAGAIASALLAVLAARSAAQSESDNLFTRGAQSYQRRDWNLAEPAFARYVRDFPQARHAADAVFYLAETRMQMGKYASARELFLRYLKDQGEAQQGTVVRARFRVGEASYLLQDLERAASELRTFRDAHPDDPLNAHALTYLGDLALSQSEWDEAQSCFEQSLREFPQSAKRTECEAGLRKAHTMRNAEISSSVPENLQLPPATDPQSSPNGDVPTYEPRCMAVRDLIRLGQPEEGLRQWEQLIDDRDRPSLAQEVAFRRELIEALQHHGYGRLAAREAARVALMEGER